MQAQVYEIRKYGERGKTSANSKTIPHDEKRSAGKDEARRRNLHRIEFHEKGEPTAASQQKEWNFNSRHEFRHVEVQNEWSNERETTNSRNDAVPTTVFGQQGNTTPRTHAEPVPREESLKNKSKRKPLEVATWAK